MRFGTRDGRFVLLAEGRVLDVHMASGGILPWEPIAALERWGDVRGVGEIMQHFVNGRTP